MLDVTIIGWGQTALNLSSSESYNLTKLRWWYVIPHLGEFIDTENSGLWEAGNENGEYDDGTYVFTADKVLKSNVNLKKSLIKFNRRFDDCNIESHAVGAVPYNFYPHPYRTPEPTWEDY